MTENIPFKATVSPQAVKRIGLVGTGLIGSGWAAHFLAQGLDVIAYDPNPLAENTMRALVDRAWPSLERLGLAKEASRDRLQFSCQVEDLDTADFIQESTPEDNAIKDKVMAAISEVVGPEVIIASSTSSIVPTRLQTQCQHPERMIVGHPFNPVYLLPLVEVVAGRHTSPEAASWAMSFYQHWGKSPLLCRAETPGHLGNRLQAAIGAEARKLVTEGIATTSDVDAALSSGPGMRWALIGSFMTEHIAAGDGGLRETLMGKFDADSSSDEAPDSDLIERILTGNQSQVAGRSLRELEQIRDEFLVGVLKLQADIQEKYGFTQSRFWKNQ